MPPRGGPVQHDGQPSMKFIHSQPLLFSASLLLLGSFGVHELAPRFTSASSTADAVAYRALAERTLEKRFVQHSEMSLVDFKVTIDGPDGPQEPEIPDQSYKIVDDETIEFSDLTIAAGEGRPERLKRSFTSIENSIKFESDQEGAEENTLKNESGLAGKSVLFTWNSEAEKFEVEWFEDKGDDALLEPMVEDADFRGWLPGKNVDDGDSWTIPAAEFHNLQEPSGPMGYHPADADEEAESNAEEARPEVKGELKATYKGTRDEDGVKVGVIAIEGKLSTLTERELKQGDGPSAQEATEFTTELEGELLWDLTAGHFHSLRCDGAQTLESTQTSSFAIGESSITLKQVRTLEGKKTYRFSCK